MSELALFLEGSELVFRRPLSPQPGLIASLLITFPSLLSREGVKAGSRFDGLTTLDYTLRPRRPVLSLLLSPRVVARPYL